MGLAGFIFRRTVLNKFGNDGFLFNDVFTVVYETVLGTAFYIGEQCIEPAYLPVFTRARKEHGDARAWRYTSTLFNLQFLILVVLVGAFALWPDFTIRFTTQWDPQTVSIERAAGAIEGKLIGESGDAYVLSVDGKEVTVPRTEVLNSASLPTISDLQEKHARRSLAEKMMLYIAPGLLGMSLGSLTYALLNGYKIFFFAAFGDSVLKICILLGAVIGATLGRGDWRWIALGASVGGFAKLATHIFALGREWFRNYSPFAWDIGDPYVREFFWLVSPLLLGILVSRGRDVVLVNVQTSKANLPSYFKMGKQVLDFLSFLVPYTLSIALLPYFCDMAARDDRNQLGALLTRIIRMLIWFFVPVAVILACAALPLCMTLYGGEKVTLVEAGYAAMVFKIYCLQFPFLAMEMMINQAFFSTRRMIAPTIAGFVSSVIIAAVPYYLVVEQKMNDTTSILLIIALSVTIGRALKSLALVGMLKSTVPVLPLGETAVFITRVLVAGAASGGAALGAAWAYRGPLKTIGTHLHQENLKNGVETVFIALAGAIAYLAVSYLLRMEEPQLCWQWTQEKLRQRKAK